MKTPDLKKLLDQRFGHLSDDRLLALTIYGEARKKSREGKIAIASVVLERVEHRNWDGQTIKEVCLMP
jgi:spore germination cell wall hydrolase CwlJ-like protein